MVKHIVLYTIKDEFNKDEAVELIRSLLEPMVGQIPGLLELEVRRGYNGMDYALYSCLESAEALAAYADHPLHQAAMKQFFHMLSSRVVCDYQV